MRVDNLQIKDSEYFRHSVDGHEIKKFNIIIKEMLINYERYRPEDKKFSQAFQNMTCKIPFDSPNITTHRYGEGSAHQAFTVTLDPGSKCMYLAFSYAHK